MENVNYIKNYAHDYYMIKFIKKLETVMYVCKYKFAVLNIRRNSRFFGGWALELNLLENFSRFKTQRGYKSVKLSSWSIPLSKIRAGLSLKILRPLMLPPTLPLSAIYAINAFNSGKISFVDNHNQQIQKKIYRIYKNLPWDIEIWGISDFFKGLNWET